MSGKAPDTGLSILIEGFFLEWLAKERKVSPHTVSSYRDAFVLFFRWLGETKGVDAVDATMSDMTADNVSAYLSWLEDSRGCCAKTANNRLAAFWSFARYAARRAPQHVGQMALISDIPKRKARRKEIDFLYPAEVDWMVEACDPGSEEELMVTLLFNSGCRISELITLKGEDVMTTSKGLCHVHFLGKGRKDRTIPLWQDTSKLLTDHMARKGIGPDDYLFRGRNVEHLTRSGARSRIDRVAASARSSHPELSRKKITPHVFRHSTAMAMLASGIDISTVAIWLGHEDINTTHKYVITDMAAKEAALEKARHRWDLEPRKQYKASSDVLEFLNSL